jgi:hypothetical protein
MRRLRGEAPDGVGNNGPPRSIAASCLCSDRHHTTRFSAGVATELRSQTAPATARELAEERRRWGCPMLFLFAAAARVGAPTTNASSDCIVKKGCHCADGGGASA